MHHEKYLNLTAVKFPRWHFPVLQTRSHRVFKVVTRQQLDRHNLETVV